MTYEEFQKENAFWGFTHTVITRNEFEEFFKKHGIEGVRSIHSDCYCGSTLRDAENAYRKIVAD